MRKWIILAALLLVFAGAVGIALANLNAYLNQNKDWLASQVASALGRAVTFDEVGVSVLGGFGARVKNLRISDDPAYAKENFLRADDVQVAVKVLPAIFGRYEVRKVILDKPSLTVIRDKRGFNFDSMGKPSERAPEAPHAAAPPSGPPAAGSEPGAEAGAGAAAFLVALADIRGGELRFLDRTVSPPSDVTVGDLDFFASDLSLTKPIRLRLAAALLGAKKQNLTVEGTLGPLGSPPNVQAAPLDLSVELGPIVLDEVKKLEALAKALPPDLSGPDPIVLEARAKGTAEQLSFEAELDGSGAAIRYGKSFAKPKGVPLKLALSAERRKTELDVRSLSLRLAELELAGKGTVGSVPGAPIDVQLDSKSTPLSGWDRMLPALEGHDVSGHAEVHVHARGKVEAGRIPELTGVIALQDVSAKQEGSPYEIDSLSTKIELQGDSAVLPPTKFQLGGSPIELEAKVQSLRSRAGTFVLRSPELRAASLGVGSPEAKKAEVMRGLEAGGQFRVAEQGAEFHGNIRSSDGSLRDVDYRDLAAEIAFEEEIARLDRLSLRAFEGSYDGKGRYDLREPANPKFSFQSNVRDMVLKTLLSTKFPGAEEKIEGRLDANLALSGSGSGWETIRKTLRGDGRMDVKDGVLKDVNIADQVLASVTGIGGLSNLVSPRTRGKYPEIFSTGDTRFEKLGGTVQVADGEARTNDMTLAARDYAVLGRGSFALENRLDFTATLVASKQLSDDVVADVKEAKYIENDDGRIEIPFRLSGSLPGVRPKPDGEFITRALARAAVGKGIEKLFGGKRKETPRPGEPTPRPETDLLRKGLEGLFGR